MPDRNKSHRKHRARVSTVWGFISDLYPTFVQFGSAAKELGLSGGIEWQRETLCRRQVSPYPLQDLNPWLIPSPLRAETTTHPPTTTPNPQPPSLSNIIALAASTAIEYETFDNFMRWRGPPPTPHIRIHMYASGFVGETWTLKFIPRPCNVHT